MRLCVCVFFFLIWKSWIFWRNWKFWLIIFFFLKNLEVLNFFKELKILIGDFFFFLKQPKKYEPNAPSPKAFFENFLFFFFFLKDLQRIDFFFYFLLKYEDLFIIKRWRRWRWRFIHDDFFSFFFFFEKPILWMRITLAGSWCGLLDKSLLTSCKKIISISNGFIHWNELEVLTQCP